MLSLESDDVKDETRGRRMWRFHLSRRAYALLSLPVVFVLALILFSGHLADFWQYRPPAIGIPKFQQPSSHYSDVSTIVPPWNRPPQQHVPEVTPLFIGFTRNWSILKQAVVSYVTAGWPASDIYVVDNTGTMQSNALNQLTPENPFYLDHAYLTRTLGVNVLTTPTLLNFAQLQNYFLYTAIVEHWPHYFWSHMDVVAMTNEAYDPFDSLYLRAVDVLRNATTDPKFGLRFFAYDHLTLVHTKAYSAVGGWDTFIPYYMTDCDFHFRLDQAGWTFGDVHAGFIADVGDSLPDITLLFRQDTNETRASCNQGDIDAAASTIARVGSSTEGDAYGRADCRYHALRRMVSHLDQKKHSHEGGRNYWQIAQKGGDGEPFWIYPDGFENALQMTIEHGRQVYAKKWSEPSCALIKAGQECKDPFSCTAWRGEEEGD